MPHYQPRILVEFKTMKEPFNDQQLKQTFRKHDKDKNGLLSWEELKEAFQELGSQCPIARAWLGIHCADANGDGFVGEDEMNVLVKYAMKVGYTVK